MIIMSVDMFTYKNIPMEVYETNYNSDFWKTLKRKWDDLHESNVLRYKINEIKEKFVGEQYLLQLNPDRGSKRRDPEIIKSIVQPFNKNLFNFTKVLNEEIIMNISNQNNSGLNSIIVNVSPISRYHSLICPSINQCLPQVVTIESLILVLEIMFLCQDRNLRIGFNSLGALASVNHLHYHILVESQRLPVEYIKCKYLAGELFCYADESPAPGFCFQIKKSEHIQKLSENVFKLIKYFLEDNIAHNLMLTHGDELNGDGSEVIRIVVWPRKIMLGEKQLRAFNVAVCEFSGWFPIFNNQDYDELLKEDLECELKKWAFKDFQELCVILKSLYT